MAALAEEEAPAACGGPEFDIGDRVRITGIQARPELNGTVTVIQSYLPDQVAATAAAVAAATAATPSSLFPSVLGTSRGSRAASPPPPLASVQDDRLPEAAVSQARQLVRALRCPRPHRRRLRCRRRPPPPAFHHVHRRRAIPPDESTDWSWLEDENGALDLLAVLRNPAYPYPHEDVCDAFAAMVMHDVTQGQPTGPKQIFTRSNVLKTMLGNAGIRHAMYFLAFDQVSHHCVLEVYEGKARLFQVSALARPSGHLQIRPA